MRGIFFWRENILRLRPKIFLVKWNYQNAKKVSEGNMNHLQKRKATVYDLHSYEKDPCLRGRDEEYKRKTMNHTTRKKKRIEI